DARTRGAYHFGQSLVTQCRYFGIPHGAVFAQARELQENPGQPLLAMVEKLIAEIFFKVDIARQQRTHELFGKLGLVVKSTKHRLFLRPGTMLTLPVSLLCSSGEIVRPRSLHQKIM